MEHSGVFMLLEDEEHFIDLIEDILKDPDLTNSFYENSFYENSFDEVINFVDKALEFHPESLVLELLDEAERRYLNGK